MKRRLEAKLETLSANEKKDNTLTFEELGIDRLFIDEAHKFKNLFYVTKMTRVAGLPQTASERAFDLFLKVQHIQAKNRGGGVVFATGTPISNTMAEMFTMQRYLQMGSAAPKRPPTFRLMGRDVRRNCYRDGTEPGRSGLPFAKPLRALRECARVDAAVSPGGGRADGGDAQAADSQARPRRANHYQRSGDAGVEALCRSAREARGEDQKRQGRSARRQHAEDHDRGPESCARSAPRDVRAFAKVPTAK